jgi:hypothetical protein
MLSICLVCRAIDADRGCKYLSRQIRKPSAINTYLQNKRMNTFGLGPSIVFLGL